MVNLLIQCIKRLYLCVCVCLLFCFHLAGPAMLEAPPNAQGIRLFHFTWFVVLTSGFGHLSTDLMAKSADLLHSLCQRFLCSVATLGPLVNTLILRFGEP
uniref:Uncharacterized protein n=1 Tax=Anopheles aquasalis TaxID=42839 RepID=T1DP59_ANOAQ